MFPNKVIFFCLGILLCYSSCKSDNQTEEPTNVPKLILKFKFDPTQERLGNFGEPQTIPDGHAAQTPTFNTMGVHFIELSRANDIPAYNGTQLYESPTTTQGGGTAIDYDQALYGGNGDTFFEIPLNQITPDTYKYLRISLSYQNYTIDFRAQNTDLKGTIASFIGANTYINSYKIKDESVIVNGNKLQGYWGFETHPPHVQVSEGQAPPGATTVPNPIFENSPIPAGSCLVTGTFNTPLVIRGNETSDIVITCSISINKSFEWEDHNQNGTYEPLEGDTVVDMGVRGLIPIVQ